MAWSTPRTWSSGEDLTADLMNDELRDQLDETAPAIATAAGRMIVTDGANSIVERVPATATVLTVETRNSTSYGDMTTPGPAVTVTTGTSALVIVTANLRNSGTGLVLMSHTVSGASTKAASDDYALINQGTDGDERVAASFMYLWTSLTAGSNTFTAKYRVTANVGTIASRHIIVVPF